MRHESHTNISILKSHINAWRKRMGWSRETVTQEIVKYFEANDGPNVTGIRFNPDTQDVFERTKVMADRLWRWLDDDGKDNNLLPANFMFFVVGAMPRDLRISCTDELLIGTGLAVRVLDADGGESLSLRLQRLMKEGGEAQLAIVGLLDGHDEQELLKAQRELIELQAEIQSCLEYIAAQGVGG